MSEVQVTGPIQVFVIGFKDFQATGQILAELQNVRKRGVIRVVDLLFVQKDEQGKITNTMHTTDLSEEERQRLGAIAGSLLGLEMGGIEGAIVGAEAGAMQVAERDFGLSQDRLHELGESIPPGTSGAILVIEHHWATRLRNAIAEAGGVALAQAMVSPRALLMVGKELNAVVELAAVELIEEAAIMEAAEVVAAALAVEDAATEHAIAALVAADLIEQDAMEEATQVVELAMAVEDEAIDEAVQVLEAADEIKRAAALEVMRVLITAELIEEAAAKEAVDALIAAELIEEAAADETLAAILAADDSST